MTPPLCDKCRSFMVDLLEKRIRRTLEVGRTEDEFQGNKDGASVESAKAQCFHFMEIRNIVEGKGSCGVFDDFGPPNTIDGPLFTESTVERTQSEAQHSAG